MLFFSITQRHQGANHTKWHLIALVFLQGFWLHAQERVYQGVVQDSEGQVLVFASIQIAGTHRGVFTDLDGRFSLSAQAGENMQISYVGYQSTTIALGQETNLVIVLEAAGHTLEAVVVRPQENPAWRIIRQAIANKDLHDPAQLDGYTYDAYHKTVFSVDSLDSFLPEKTRPKKKPTPARQRRDSLQQIANAKALRRQELFLHEMHLWVTETRSEHAFRSPNQHKETVLATRSSMPNDFTGGINPINFQPFGFYQEVIRMEVTDQNYVNPLSRGTFSHYAFEMADTVVHATDTTYIIEFWPLPKKSFIGLKGLLYINTDGYAIENVIAEPSDTLQTLQFVIQQQSARVDGRWFPQQLNADLFLQMGTPQVFVGYGFRNRSIINNVLLEAPPAKLFNHYRKENNGINKPISDSLRLLPLEQREANTYAYWDSLELLRPAYRFLKGYNGIIKLLSSGLWTGRSIDLVVPDLWRVNAYEGNRFGLGLKTSPKLSQRFSLYGYAAYGLRDEGWKYGGAAEAILYRHRDLRLRLSYSDDLAAPGEINFLSSINNPWSNFSARNLVLNRLDRQEQWRADIVYRPHPAWQLNFFGSKVDRQLTYSYNYGETTPEDGQGYELYQSGLRLRWAPKEQLIKMEQLEAILFPTFPILDISAEQLHWPNSKSLVHRLGARLTHEQRWKYLGTTELSLQAGWLSESSPYPFLFQAPGNGGNGISGGAVFNTAGVTEFGQDYFAFMFLTHRFGPLLGRPRTPYFRPELRLVQQLGWGELRSPALHQGIAFSDMRHTYLESGVGLDNVLRIPYFKALYIGLGATVWYRWGAYHLPTLKENARFQLTLNLSV